MDYTLFITVDTNDADYLTSVNKISEEDLEKIKPLIEAIKNFKPYSYSVNKNSFLHQGYVYKHEHNYPTYECLREDLGEKSPQKLYSQFSEEIHEMFSDLCPQSDNGFHSVVNVSISPWVEKTRLL